MIRRTHLLSFANRDVFGARRIAAQRRFVDLLTLLAIALLLAACGTGIAVEPAPWEQPPAYDGGDAQSADVALTDGRRDATAEPGVTAVDGGEDRSQPIDGPNDRPDASADVGPNGDDASTSRDASSDGDVASGEDVSSDVALDPPVDRDAPRDASSEIGADGSTDARRDGDAAIGVPDARDAVSESADAPEASPKDAEHDLAAEDGDGCSMGCEVDYYVNATAPFGGNGSQAAPFRTITSAVAAHTRAPNHPRTAHIAAGTYNEALGEIFPLVLRGLSLEGAGSDKTFIAGAGPFDHSGQGGPKGQQYMVTIVAGDRVMPTNVSRLSLHPAQQVPATGFYGVFCDRGNATGEVASPAGQTHLDELSVGPGFDTSVLVLPSTALPVTGCNMLMTRTTLTGGWTGVLAVGCDGSDVAVPVILEMGTDDPASANTVTSMQGQNGMGNGVFLNSCVARASFQYKTIANCSTGINVGGSAAGPIPSATKPFVFKHNTFARMSNIGLYDWGSAISIEEISDNRFLDSTRSADAFQAAVGLRIEQPNVGKVRRNVFTGNDIGLRLDMGAEQTDLGRPGDPGTNTFYCNSGIDGWLGSDVSVVYPMVRGPRGILHDDAGADAGGDDAAGGDDGAADGGSSGLPFAGNAWDHVPPRVESVDLATNGVEISLEWAPPLVFDLSGASLVTTPCPTGRIP